MIDAPRLNQVRQMILDGILHPGERITEAGLAHKLGTSRTPIRSILPALAAEGFLEAAGRRGYVIASFNRAATLEAVELRALLEGQAARFVAQRGAPQPLLDELDHLLDIGDEIVATSELREGYRERYGDMNTRFHRAIIEASGSAILIDMIERLNRIPFVNPSAMVFDRHEDGILLSLLYVAHWHHHTIVEALREGDAFRCEMLFREHGNDQRLSMFEKLHPHTGSNAIAKRATNQDGIP